MIVADQRWSAHSAMVVILKGEEEMEAVLLSMAISILTGLFTDSWGR